MASNYKRLGNYIQQVDVRNTDLSVELLLGVSIEKKFIESHANTVGTDFSKYKIVKRGQFAYGPVTSRNGDKISIALLDEADACLISSSYTPFEIVKPDELNAEYLMMLFRNPEYDRFARYNSWGSAREVFSWEDFCDSELYIPDIKEQQKIVRQYKTITDRIEVLEKINEELEQLLMIMFNNLFDTDDLQNIKLGKLTDIKTESINPSKIKCDHVWHYSIPAFDDTKLPVHDETESILSNKYKVPKKCVMLSKLNPQTKRIWRSIDTYENAICSTEFIVFTPYKNNYNYFLYPLLNTDDFTDFMISNATGTTNSRTRIKPKVALDYTFNCPSDESISDFCEKVHPIYEITDKIIAEINELKKMMVHIKVKTC